MTQFDPGLTAPSAEGLLARRRDKPPSKQELWSCTRRMVALVRPHRRAMAWGMILGVGVAVAYAASLAGLIPVLRVIIEGEGLHEWLIQKADKAHDGTGAFYAPILRGLASLFPEVADISDPQAVADARFKTLVIVVALLIGVNLVGNLFRVFSQYLVIYASNRAIMDLRRHMYRKALRVPMTAITGKVSNTVSQFMTDVREMFLGIVTLFGKVAREPLKAIAILVVAFAVDPRLTAIVLAIGPIAVLLLWYFGRKVRKATVRLLQGYARMLNSLEETLQGIIVVKSYAREGHERRRMWQLERRMFKPQMKLAWVESISSPLIEVIGLGIASAGIIWLGSKAIGGEIDSTHFIVMVGLLAAMLDPIRKVANVYNNVQRASAAAYRVFAFLDWPEEVSPRRPERLPNRPHEVQFTQVTFRYLPEAEPAVRDLTLTVEPGECVAVVGPNGSGKSTLLKLLPRFLEPQAGVVLIDGLDVRDLSLKALREQIAIVAQDPVIFARSAFENIAYGKPDATLEEVRDAARRAFAADFIEAWPDQYETVLGEHGASISGGQRQRLAIARAFLKPASIVIFDEATSEVDAESERKIHAALAELRKGKTTFLIAHRHTVMDMADRIIVMDAGQIVDTGPHDDLLQRCPLYQALYAKVAE
jgi:ABC-type multidrug transport system fused ATPase/permease subunit